MPLRRGTDNDVSIHISCLWHQAGGPVYTARLTYSPSDGIAVANAEHAIRISIWTTNVMATGYVSTNHLLSEEIITFETRISSPSHLTKLAYYSTMAYDETWNWLEWQNMDWSDKTWSNKT